MLFLWNVLEQKNISEKNIEYLRAMALRYPGELGARAAALAEHGLVHPRKRKRYGFLAQHRPEVYDNLVKLGLIEDERNIDEFDDEGRLTKDAAPFEAFAEYAQPDYDDDGLIPF